MVSLFGEVDLNLIVCRPKSATATNWVRGAAEFRRLPWYHLQANSAAIEIITRIGKNTAVELVGRACRIIGCPGHVASVPAPGVGHLGLRMPFHA